MATKRSLKEEPGVSCEKKAKTSPPASDSSDDDDGPVVIKCKTTFKKRIVERALEREDERSSADDLSPEPLTKYFVKYSVKNDLLSVGGLEVLIDEDLKILRCSQCAYVTRIKWETDKKKMNTVLMRMETGIRNHVIGSHLGGFPCKLCDPPPVFQSLSSCQRHVLEEHNEARKELDARIRASLVAGVDPGGGKKEGEGESVEGEGEEEEDLLDLFGNKPLKKQWKCGYDNCGKRFHKMTRWIKHEKAVHGAVKERNIKLN